MPSIAYAVPLKPGMYDQIRDQLDEFFGRSNEQTEQHARQTLGIETAKIYYQTEPIEALVFYLEGKDLEHALHPTRHQGHDLEEAWNRFLEQVSPHGRNVGRTSAALPAQLLVDWHHQEGHRHQRPPRAKA